VTTAKNGPAANAGSAAASKAAADAAERAAETAAAAAAAEAAIEAAAAAAAAEAAAAEAAAARKKEEEMRRNGTVVVRYNHYKKVLQISESRLACEAVDDELSLSFVFKNCKIHLALSDGTEKEPREPAFVKEEGNPVVFTGVEGGQTYWAMVEEDNAEKAAFEERQAKKAVPIYTGKSDDDVIVREKVEGCSCIWGNPCMDSSCCRDWNNRYDVAKSHGWRG
jgi:hypothetical protein